LFGVLSYSVAQRTREIGVRTALGASTRSVVELVVRQGTVITVTGLVGGMAVAAVIVRSLSAVLYGIGPYDAVTFAAVPVALALVAALASIAPALRAARIDPLKALRSQ
jgi:ABC-type antimicrobial peptide transport system permease subunit